MLSFRLFVFLFFICSISFAQQPRLVIPVGHTEAISDCQFSPNGKFVVTASFDETACIWNAETGQLVHQLKGHKGYVRSAAFSASGNLVLTCSDDLTVRLWDAVTGDSLFLFNTNNRLKSNCFALFSPGGDSIVMSSNDSLLQICDVKTGSVLQVLHGNRLNIEGASFSVDGTKIISRSKLTARIWDVATGKITEGTIKLNAIEGFQSVRFSSDSNKILSCLNSDKLVIWDATTGIRLPSFADNIPTAKFGPLSPDGKQIVARLKNNTVQLMNVETGAVEVNFENKKFTGSLIFSPDGKQLAARSNTGKVMVWDALTGKLLGNDSISSSTSGKLCFSPNGSFLLTTDEKEITITDLKNNHDPLSLKGHAGTVDDALFSTDGKTFFAYSKQRGVEEWETATGKPLRKHLNNMDYKSGRELLFLPDGKRALVFKNGPARISDIKNDSTILWFNGNTDSISKFFVSGDGSLAISYNDHGMASVWNLATGNLTDSFDLGMTNIGEGLFSPDNKFFITTEQGGTKKAVVRNLSTKNFSDTNTIGADHLIKKLVFSNTGNKVAIGSVNGMISLWDAEKGEQIWEKQINRYNNYEFLVFTPDDQWILAASQGRGVLQLINANTGAKEWELNSIRPWFVEPSAFSSDGKQFFTFSFNNTFCKRNLSDGKVIDSMELGTYSLADFNYESNLLLLRNNSEIKLMRLDGNKHLYSLYAIDSTDYLLTDSKGHYDGTRNARKLLYLVCGQEVIGLDQVKDDLWVPNLATRIMNGETIQEKSLADLNICNNVPLIILKESATEYQFVITPQRGGLGDIIISINGMETQTLQKEDLTQEGNSYIYSVTTEFVNSIEGDQKEVKVRAMTADNKIASADVIVKKGSATTTTIVPDIYAVFIGVSDYKGDKLDLQYAAKDAKDLGHAFEAAAKKFLNTEPGKEHVFIYRLNTDTPNTGLPYRATIHQTLLEIGTKSKPNDILLIFFAGHGVMLGEKEQFYFLTADAADSIQTDAIEQAGISMDTLKKWVHPSLIKAQNRILIFDACNSGQAITNLLTVNGDIESKQIKTIEELNTSSKFFILSASARNQSAYEYGMYSQGMLTYSLLNTIKLNQAIFNKRNFLDVSKWFTASNELLTELVKQNKVRQEPQLVSSNTFNVGVVDEDVRNQIQLPEGKPMFGRSEFRNTELRIDNLKLRDAVYDAFNAVITSAATTSILFNETYEGVGVTSLSCDYTVSNGRVTVSVLLIKDGKSKFDEFTIEADEADIKKLGTDIVAKATELILKK